MIPVTELGRRICVARHPYRGQTGATIPCAEDQMAAERSYGLIGEQGTVTFGVIAAARVENGLAENGADAVTARQLALLVESAFTDLATPGAPAQENGWRTLGEAFGLAREIAPIVAIDEPEPASATRVHEA